MEFAQVVGAITYGQIHKDLVNETAHDCERMGSKVIHFDVRRLLTKDPSKTIEHKENGLHAQTQKTVMSQAGFVDACKDIVIEVANYNIKEWPSVLVLVECRRGFHRSDTVGRMCNAMLNFMLSRNQIFNSGEQCGRRGHISMLESVKAWMEPGKAWELAEGGEVPYAQLYASQAVRDDHMAYPAWKSLWDWVYTEYHMVRIVGPVLPPGSPPRAEKSRRVGEGGKGAGGKVYTKGGKEAGPVYGKSGTSSAWRPVPTRG
ncbi:unnamed protein product, partial [Prorocentrum cordatum]